MDVSLSISVSALHSQLAITDTVKPGWGQATGLAAGPAMTR